ncbi:MAG: hypothetical protein IJA57_04445 [Alistipes sp.]|nr:hypothetical protein [Alistipes sp.]
MNTNLVNNDFISKFLYQIDCACAQKYGHKKTLGDTKRFLQIRGGRWGSNGEAEARIPLKINIFLSSQPTKQHSSYKQKQSAEGAVFGGGAFGCSQTESAYNKKTQGL